MKKYIIFLMILLCLCACQNNAHNINNEENKEQTMKQFYITINNQDFPIHFYENETVEKLVQQFPMIIKMTDLHGNEKYYNLPDIYPTNHETVGNVQAGDLMLFGDSCLVLFYESFQTSYQYTKLGYIEDSNGFKEIVGNGYIEVKFQGGNE